MRCNHVCAIMKITLLLSLAALLLAGAEATTDATANATAQDYNNSIRSRERTQNKATVNIMQAECSSTKAAYTAYRIQQHTSTSTNGL